MRSLVITQSSKRTMRLQCSSPNFSRTSLESGMRQFKWSTKPLGASNSTSSASIMDVGACSRKVATWEITSASILVQGPLLVSCAARRSRRVETSVDIWLMFTNYLERSRPLILRKLLLNSTAVLAAIIWSIKVVFWQILKKLISKCSTSSPPTAPRRLFRAAHPRLSLHPAAILSIRFNLRMSSMRSNRSTQPFPWLQSKTNSLQNLLSKLTLQIVWCYHLMTFKWSQRSWMSLMTSEVRFRSIKSSLTQLTRATQTCFRSRLGDPAILSSFLMTSMKKRSAKK